MKVIDLLNKIANGEEIPKKVKVGYYYYEYEENGEYINTENTEDLLFDFDSYYPLEQCLNEDVEIIEEPKKIEYPILHNTAPSETTGDQMPNWRNLIDCNFEHLNKTIYQLIDEINEIIDYIMEDK